MIPTDLPSGRWRADDVFIVLARWLVGALFIYMGLSKALDPVGFLKLVRQYELLHASLPLNLVASALPWFEVFCGLLLVLGVAVRGTALMSVAMLVPFTLLVLRHALELSKAGGQPLCDLKFDCGCGGGEVWICGKLMENSLLTLLSIWFDLLAEQPTLHSPQSPSGTDVLLVLVIENPGRGRSRTRTRTRRRTMPRKSVFAPKNLYGLNPTGAEHRIAT